MMRNCLALVLLATCQAAISANKNLESLTFEEFENTFNRKYSSPEIRTVRKEIFEKNLSEIISLNKASKNTIFNVNEFTDMTGAEMAQMSGYSPQAMPSNFKNSFTASTETVDLSSLPPSVDWSSVLTPVKHQGHCGSCWAFSATAQVEAYNVIAGNPKGILSTQQLVDCVPNVSHCGGVGGCSGSTAPLSFQYLSTGHVHEFEHNYPYEARLRSCREKDDPNVEGVVVVGYEVLKSNDYASVMHHLAHKGPLSVNVDASDMKFYSGGVFDLCEKSNSWDINHVVQLIGYGVDENTGLDYWLVRNSWGSKWGEQGLMRLKRTTPDKDGQYSVCKMDEKPLNGVDCETDDLPSEGVLVCGECGLLYETSYPKIGTRAPASIRI